MDDFNAMDAFSELLAKARFQAENEVFNGMIEAHAEEMDVEAYTQLVNFISAFNKHGVSTKTLFDVMNELNANRGVANE